MTSYNIIEGTLLRLYTSTPFTEIGGTVADPTTVIFAFQVESGAVQSATYGTPASFGTIVRDSTGTYHIDIDTTGLSGVWNYVWVGSGVVTTRAENQLYVTPMGVSIAN